MTRILQKSIPHDVLNPRPLPGIQPLELATWLHADDAFAGQMARREALLRDQRADVLAMDDNARPAAEELLDLVLARAYGQVDQTVTRPDGVEVNIDRSDPMGTLGRIVQEDFCILEKQGDEHVLTAAVLCFPASWRLAEKFMRPLTAIHVPVEVYDANLARRVQRLFDGVQPGRPLWRFNALWYADPELHQPRSAQAPREVEDAQSGRYMRSEKQCILRLPQTRAVVFSIHTYVVDRADLIPAST
jgi:hypothetical protein